MGCLSDFVTFLFSWLDFIFCILSCFGFRSASSYRVLGELPQRNRTNSLFEFQILTGNMVQNVLIIFKCLTQKVVSDHQFPRNFAHLHSLSLARPSKKIQITVTDSVSAVNFPLVVRSQVSIIETDAARIAQPPLPNPRIWAWIVQDVKCKGCGSTIKSDSNFCRHCGMPNKAGFCMSFLHHVAIFIWFPCYSFDIKLLIIWLVIIRYPIPKDAVCQIISITLEDGWWKACWIRPIRINTVSECMSVGIPFVSVYYY